MLTKLKVALYLAVVLLGLTGCTTQENNIDLTAVGTVTQRAQAQPVEPPQDLQLTPLDEPQVRLETVLTLREAINRALHNSPALRAAELEIDAKHGEAAQAVVRPNPEASLEVENFGGTGDTGGFSSAEETLAISQLIELGGKRVARIAVANLDRVATIWDYEAERLRVIRETAGAFIDVLAIQEAIAHSAEANRIARELERDVKARVDAGNASPIEVQRTRPVVANTLVRLEVERARLEPAKRRLASMWGASRALFERVGGRFSRDKRLPTIDRILADLARNPQVARWSDEISRRDAAVSLELANAVPDLKVGAGLRRLNETNDTSVVASVAFALPIFDRNAGNIAAAKSRLAKAEYERVSDISSLRASIFKAYGDLAGAAAEVRTLSTDVVPAARSAYRAVQTSFQAGKANLFAVLDSRRVLFDAQLNLITAQAKFEKAKIGIEGLVGRKI